MDPLEHFHEQQGSEHAIDSHKAALAAQAVEVIREDPNHEPVGVLAAPGTPEAEWVQKQPWAPASREGSGFSGLLSRGIVVEILRQSNPALLDWIVDSHGPDGRRFLPIVVFTKNGSRAAGVELDVGG